MNRVLSCNGNVFMLFGATKVVMKCLLKVLLSVCVCVCVCVCMFGVRVGREVPKLLDPSWPPGLVCLRHEIPKPRDV